MLIRNNQVCVNRGKEKCECYNSNSSKKENCDTGATCIATENEHSCKNTKYKSYECNPKDFCYCSSNFGVNPNNIKGNPLLCDLSGKIKLYTTYPVNPDDSVLTNAKRLNEAIDSYLVKNVSDLNKKVEDRNKI